MKRPFFKVFLIYLSAVAVYAVFVNCFTIPVHLGVDEELYISMARSFHYEGVFAKEGQILDYSCVLYSMLLSVAYFFYSPERILFLLRMVGVIVMLSSVFPIYLLGKEILEDEKKAIKVVLFSCLLPSILNTAYCMQEVMCYPLFLWLVYSVYIEMDQDRIGDLSWTTVLIVLLSVLCYFTKTYTIFIPVLYVLFIIYNSVCKKASAWKKILFCLIMYLGLYLLGKWIIWMINDKAVGVNHYSEQFSHLFPITFETIFAAFTCGFFYCIACLFYTGILPIILPIYNRGKYKVSERNFLYFIFGGLVILVVEVVVSIVLTEEGNVLFPHKFLWRYFQIFEVPIILLFLKKYREMEIPSWIWKIYIVVFGGLLVYYIWIGNGQRTSVIDAPVFLLMENINRYVLPHFNLLIIVLTTFFVGIIGFFERKSRIKNIVEKYIWLAVSFIVVFFVINIFQLPFYTNHIAEGKTIEEEAMKIAEVISESGYKKVFYIESKNDRYERAVYAYLPVDICYVEEERWDLKMMEDDALIIILRDSGLPNGLKELDLNTGLYRICVKSES